MYIRSCLIFNPWGDRECKFRIQKDSLVRTFLRMSPPRRGLVTFSMPLKTKELVLPACAAWQCLDTMEAPTAMGRPASERWRLILVFRLVVVQPTYCKLQTLHVIRKITLRELQLMYLRMGNVSPVWLDTNSLVTCAKLHALHWRWPQR